MVAVTRVCYPEGVLGLLPTADILRVGSAIISTQNERARLNELIQLASVARETSIVQRQAAEKLDFGFGRMGLTAPYRRV